MNPWWFPGAAFCILSHKVLRYGAFAFMPIAFAANGVLATGARTYLALFAAQVLVYVLAILGVRKKLTGPLGALTVVPTYFIVSNAAFALAFAKFVRGETMATWQPRAG